MDEAGAVPAVESQERALAGLQDLVGFHISLANTTIKAHFQRHFAGLRLTQKQIAVLWLVDGAPGIVQVELARHLRVKRATMSAMVDKLAARGLLVRGAEGERDARHVPLALTPDGEAALRDARAAIARHETWVKARYTPAERRTVAELMRRIYDGAD